MLLARSLVSAGDPKSAITVLRRSLVRYPGDLWTNLELAELLGKSTPPQWEDAIRFYTVVHLRLRPEAGWNLIVALLNETREREAEQLLDEFLRVDPGNLNLLSNLALDIDREKRKLVASRMIAPFKARLASSPNEAAVHWKIAALSYAYGDGAVAIAEYRQTARLDPLNDGCRYELGVMLQRIGDVKGAIAAYREAIWLAPTYPLYREGLAALLSRSGDLNGEIAELRETIRCEALHRTRGDTARVKRGSELFENDGCLGTYYSGLLDRYLREFLIFSPGVGAYTKLSSALVESGDLSGAITLCEEGTRLGEESDKSRLSTVLGNLQFAAWNLPLAMCGLPKDDSG